MERSSPYNPRSNGLAEASVKAMRGLLSKLDGDWSSFPEALREWRNTPRAEGVSPAVAFLGRRQRGLLPAAAAATTPVVDFPGHTRTPAEPPRQGIKPLIVGQRVRVQDAASGRWKKRGVLAEILSERRYRISLDNGTEVVRNRRFVRLSGADREPEGEPEAEPEAEAGPRRSRRTRGLAPE